MVNNSSITKALNNIVLKSSQIRDVILAKTNKDSLTNVNIKADISTKKSISKEYLATSIIDIIELIHNVESILKPINDSDIIDVVDANANNKMTLDIQHHVDQCQQVTKDAVIAVNAQQTRLEQKIDEINGLVDRLTATGTIAQPSKTKPHIDDVEPYIHQIKPVMKYEENFLSSDVQLHNELLTFLSKQEFNNDGILFGESFQMEGESAKPLPSCFRDVMKNLNDNIKEGGGNYEINSCRVVKFDSKSLSKQYCHNEYSINPESNIFSLCLGTSQTFIFTEKFSAEEETFETSIGSLLTMSRNSQNIFSHRIKNELPNQNLCGFVLTFKCQNINLMNSTCIVGDSNTKGIKFGSGKGTVGERYPGKQVYSPVIKDIDPLSCASYQNVVLSLGVNDVRQSDVKCYDDIKQVYATYKSKLRDINQLNPGAKVFIVPILPTSSEALNAKICDYNRLLINDLHKSFYNVSIVDGVPRFLDSRNLLKKSLFRKAGDILHINSAGHALLVRLVKDSIFRRRSNFVDGRSYSSSLKGTGEGYKGKNS